MCHEVRSDSVAHLNCPPFAHTLLSNSQFMGSKFMKVQAMLLVHLPLYPMPPPTMLITIQRINQRQLNCLPVARTARIQHTTTTTITTTRPPTTTLTIPPTRPTPPTLLPRTQPQPMSLSIETLRKTGIGAMTNHRASNLKKKAGCTIEFFVVGFLFFNFNTHTHLFNSKS